MGSSDPNWSCSWDAVRFSVHSSYTAAFENNWKGDLQEVVLEGGYIASSVARVVRRSWVKYIGSQRAFHKELYRVSACRAFPATLLECCCFPFPFTLLLIDFKLKIDWLRYASREHYSLQSCHLTLPLSLSPPPFRCSLSLVELCSHNPFPNHRLLCEEFLTNRNFSTIDIVATLYALMREFYALEKQFEHWGWRILRQFQGKEEFSNHP